MTAKAIEFGKDFILLYEQYLAINQENKRLKTEINRLKKEIEMNNKLMSSTINDCDSPFKRERKISDNDILKIQEMYKQGFSYRQIEKETGWSKYTIGKAINNKY